MWKKTWKNKVKPNRENKNPTISFRSNLEPRELSFIRAIARTKSKSKWISKAIAEKHFRDNNSREYLYQLLEENYELSRFLLRKIGSKRNRQFNLKSTLVDKKSKIESFKKDRY